jgi:hypothetical protein
VPTAAKPAATAASLATRFRVEVLGRTDFFDFAGRLAFVVLLVFDLAPARFKLVFDLTRRFDEVLDLLRFFAFFMILPIGFSSVQIGPQSGCWQADGIVCLFMAVKTDLSIAKGSSRKKAKRSLRKKN